MFSGTGTRAKTLFGLTKSSDKISDLLSKYLGQPDFTLEQFVQEYSAIIEKKKNPSTITTLTDKVSNFSDRMKYLTKEVASQVIMLTPLVDCNSPALPKINALRVLQPDEPGGEFGIIFDKYLQLQIDQYTSEGIPYRHKVNQLNTIKDCLTPMHEPELWDKLQLGSFYPQKGGRRTRYRRRKSKSKARKTRRH